MNVTIINNSGYVIPVNIIMDGPYLNGIAGPLILVASYYITPGELHVTCKYPGNTVTP